MAWLWLLAAAPLASAASLLVLLPLALLARPWDGDIQRDHRWTASAPFPVFRVAVWLLRAAELVAALKPGPLRVAELATAFGQSQVLMALVRLGVPDLLAAHGPQTAAELAAAIGPAVPADWLERLLAAAAAHGMLQRSRPRPRRWAWLLWRRSSTAAPALPVAGAGATAEQPAPAAACAPAPEAGGAQRHGAAPARQPPGSPARGVDACYALNGVSAALASDSPVCMASFVRLFESHFAAYTCLAAGIKSGVVPFQLWSGGAAYWQHLEAHADEAAVFDAAMTQVNHIGGSAAVAAFPWQRYACVVDVAGGVGAFMAQLLQRHAHLSGVVVDQTAQIRRAEKLWASRHAGLAPRVSLVAGDLFDAATLPPPPAGPASGRVAYTLRNVLHDWPDAECLAILRAIRSRIGAGDAGGRAELLLVEMTTAREVLPCLLPFRHASDITMLVAFGGGKERSVQQFEQLLAASGWTLAGLTPTNGVFIVLRCLPV